MRNRLNLISAGLMALMLVFMAGTSLPALATSETLTSGTTSTTDSACGVQASDEMHQSDSHLDNARAIGLVQQNPAFQSKISGFTSKFNSLFTIWKLDLVNCHAVQLQSVNVVHTLYNSTGGFVKNIVVTIDPQLTKVVNVTEQVTGHYSVQEDSGNWASYQYTGATFTWPNPPTTPNVWQSTGSWTEPSVSPPTSGPSNPCRTDLGKQPCDLAIFNGLQDRFKANDSELAQAGSDGKITYSGGVKQTSYFLWYELVGSQTVDCTGTSFTAGHGVQAIVTNEGKSGPHTSLYDLSVIDTSTAVGCGVTGASYPGMTSPVIASFVNERASYDGTNLATLAQFSSDAMTGSMYYSGVNHGISGPQGSGWYYRTDMKNAGSTNIAFGSVSGNVITYTYSNSLGE